jgi:hypothetical protein
MFIVDEVPVKDSNGRTGIICRYCKNWIFGPKPVEIDGSPRLEWHCIHCNAALASLPPYEEPGEDKESFKEKIILKLLEQGNCEEVVKIFATASKKPPEFIESKLRKILSDL